MNTYTLSDLKEVYNAKMYLTKDRFVHYFTKRYSYTERGAIEAFNLFSKFPLCVYNNREENIDTIIPLAIKLVKELIDAWDKNRQFENLKYDDKELRKLIYKKGDDMFELELDLHDGNDIITYACLLQQDNFSQIALLRFNSRINVKNSDNKLNIYEGDIFNTNDSFYGNKSNVFVAEKDEKFSKLLYIKGKGYLLNKELNKEQEGKYNSYAITLDEWQKIGNIYQNIYILSDN